MKGNGGCCYKTLLAEYLLREFKRLCDLHTQTTSRPLAYDLPPRIAAAKLVT